MKAQVSLEFIVFTMMAIIIVIILIGIGGRLTLQELDVQSVAEAQSLASVLQEELIIAAQVSSGYHRVIDLPVRLRSGDYMLNNTNTTFTIVEGGVSITLKTPFMNGTLVKGRNVITNENGILTISQ